MENFRLNYARQGRIDTMTQNQQKERIIQKSLPEELSGLIYEFLKIDYRSVLDATNRVSIALLVGSQARGVCAD